MAYKMHKKFTKKITHVTSTDMMAECYNGSLYPGITATHFCMNLHTKKLGNELSIISKC